MGYEPVPDANRRRPFLTARWTNLFLANYVVPDELLLPRLPHGLHLDRFEGRAVASIVAFDFHDTRVLGIGWPGYRSFPEVNLRFYVRNGRDRGVVFIRELAPLRLVKWVADLLYNESYVTMPMSSHVTETDGSITLEHRLIARDRVHTIRATGAKPAFCPGPGTVEHFFKEHRWGFGRNRRGQTLRYEVTHPCWDVYSVRDFRIDVDWQSLYGPGWAFLHMAEPVSTIFAAGSAIAVYPHGRIEPAVL